MSIDELVGLLNRVYGYDFKLNDDGSMSYTLTTYDGTCGFIIKKEDVQPLLEFDDSLEVAPVRINHSDYNEFLLRDNSGLPFRFREAHRYEYTDRDNHVVYRFSSPSLRLCLAILKYADSENKELIAEMQSRMRRVSKDRVVEKGLWFLNTVISPRFSSLTILPETGYTLDKLDCETLCTSFSFSFAYNLGRIVYQTDSIEDAYDLSTPRRLLRGRSDYMEPPKKKYIPELVRYYLRAAGGESSDYQYLSYYHILEFFFEKVFLDNVVDKIRGELTHPSFSYKRDKDIKNFYGKLKKLIRETSAQSGINELESLKLTLKLYVSDLQAVKDSINGVSPEIIQYLKTNTGPFSKNTINFDVMDTNAVYANLANRIYDTRNAIAHSKEIDSREKFLPYKHDSDLINEVLLIRLVAEEVIINSSKDL